MIFKLKILKLFHHEKSWKNFVSEQLRRLNKSEDNERLEVNEGEDLNLKCSPPKGYPKRVEFYKILHFSKIFENFDFDIRDGLLLT